MPGRGKIGPYHNNVASDVEKIIGEGVTFYPSSDQGWDRVCGGPQVEFELVPQDPVRSERAMRMRGKDSRIRRVSVFPLCTHSNSRVGTFWVSWYEAWRKQDSSNFILLNAAWTLFKGLPGDQDKTQVLRAEWDQLPHRGSKRAGHPHWHFDHDLFISAEPGKIKVKPDLVEISSDEPFAMKRWTSVGFIHLAMGTWNQGKNHPECWQRTCEDDCRQLRDWCVKTLLYLKEQIAGS